MPVAAGRTRPIAPRISAYVEQASAMQAADRGFTDVLTQTFPSARRFEAERRRAFKGFTELVARARRQAPCARTSSPRTCRCC